MGDDRFLQPARQLAVHASSLGRHAKLNASVWGEAVVPVLRCALLAEHLGQDTSGLDDRAAMRLYREVADANCRRTAAHAEGRQGLAIALAATKYGR